MKTLWPFLGIPDEGTHHFSQATNTMNLLDQFIISRGLFYGLRGLHLKRDSVEIFKPDIMRTSGKGRPKPFEFKQGRPRGYSDHFPIQAVIETV